MSIEIKQKIKEVADDFGMPAKSLIEIVGKFYDKPKSSSQNLTEDQLNVIFDYITAQNQIGSIAEVFAAAKPKEEPKAEAPAAPAPEKPSAPQQNAQQQLSSACHALNTMQDGILSAAESLQRDGLVTRALAGAQEDSAKVYSSLYTATAAVRSTARFDLYSADGTLVCELSEHTHGRLL